MVCKRQDSDPVRQDSVVHAVRKPPNLQPSNVAPGKSTSQAWIDGEPYERSVYRGNERFPQARPRVGVEQCGLCQLIDGPGMKFDLTHPRRILTR